MAKRVPPKGGLTTEELQKHRKIIPKGSKLSPSHRKAISDGLIKHHAKKHGMQPAKYKKAKAKNPKVAPWRLGLAHKTRNRRLGT